MFRDKMTDQQAKYALRKKKNGGGAASFLIGTVVVGGLMLGGTINASADDTAAPTDGSATNESTTGEAANSGNEVTLSQPAASSTTSDQAAPADSTEASTAENAATGTTAASNSGSTATPQPTAAAVMAEAATTDHLANDKISISNVRVNKSEVVESQGLDITVSFDWTGQGLEKGDMLVTPMTNGFTSITRQVETPFGANGQQMGVMVLDYDAKQIVTKFTADMDPNKIYSGTINIATFVDRDYFKNTENSVDHTVTLADGKTAQVKFDVIFDALQQDPRLGMISLYAKESKDNADQSTDIKWASVVNKAQNEMTDAIIYLSPDKITGVDPEFQTPGNGQTAWTTLGISYDENQTYVIDPATIEVYKATVYDSMGYAKQQKLVEGRDYQVNHSELNPHAYTVELLGDYATTKDQFVIEYGGNVKNSVGDRTQVNFTTSDSLVAYYEGRVLSGQGMNKYYAGPLNLNWSTANINVNNSSINGVTDEDLTGSVTVVHIDASTGNILKKEAYVVGADGTPLKNAKQGTPYATHPEDFPGFKYTMMGYSSDPASGEVKQGLQRVIYLYMPEATKKGNVDVTYIAEDGTVLEATSDVVKDGKIGSDYETTEKEFDGYHFVRMGEFSADKTGQVEEGTKHVVYVYAKNPETPVAKTGNVDVKYITKDGQVLEDVSSVKANAPVGEDYTTEEKSFAGYHFVGMDKTSDPATGLVAEGTKHVIYVYEKDVTPEVKKGNVDVTYVAEDGTVLEATSDVVKDGELGSNYETTQKPFDGYHFVRMGEFSADATGQVEEGTKHVVYVYAKNPATPVEKKGSVDVKYITKDGEVLKDVTSVKDNAPVGEDYTTEEKSFAGYHFVGMDKSSDPATGVVAEGTKHVIYVYEKDVTPEVKTGNVDVKYITKDGEVLEDVTSVKDNTPVGEDYTTAEKSFDGYHFVGMDKSSDPATGIVSEGTKHVIYVYEKDATPEVKHGNVDVTYVAEDGTVLEATSDVVKDGELGSNYETTQKPFDGYHFVRMGEFSASATGKVEEGTKHVVYVYAKDVTPEVKHGNVDVTYVAEDGTVLEATTDVVKDGEIGSNYKTTEENFDGYHFVRMGEFSADATGQVEEGTKHVVYVYAKNPEQPVEKKGSVDVKYITTDGEVLEDVSSVKVNAPVGEDYTTAEKGFDGYHFVGMDKSSDPATGIVSEGDKHVIYVYEKDATPEVKHGNVDVTYVAEDGTVLEATTDVVKDGEIGSNYETTQKPFDGYHFVRMGEFSADTTGQVEEGTKHVVYVYAKNPETPVEKKGSVDVKYITTDGQVLEDVSSVKDNAPVGEDYTTEEKSFDGYHFVGMDKNSDPATGIVSEGDKHVIYVYEKDVTPEVKKGNVDVTYLAEDGTVLKATTTVAKDAEVGTNYTTTLEAFDGYHFARMGEFSADAAGQVEEGTKHVVYIYAKTPVTPVQKTGSVDVKYVTTTGEVLADVTSVKDHAPVGEDYTTEEKHFDGYHFVGMDKSSDPATGIVSEGDKHVVYVYEKDPVKHGSVDVTYVAEDGTVLAATTDVVKDGELGTAYATEEQAFAGYHFVRMGDFSAAATGQVIEGVQHVIYVYAKNEPTPVPEPEPTPDPTPTPTPDPEPTPDHKPGVEGGTVTVEYVDENGNPLPGGEKTTVKDQAPVGEAYTTEEKTFEGYHFVGMGNGSATPSGQVQPGEQHVVYVYTKDTPTPDHKPGVEGGTVTVEYVDENGNPLPGGEKTTVKDQAPVGEVYTTEEKTFEGYHFVGMGNGSATPSGQVQPGEQHVVYVYTKDTPTPTVDPTPQLQPETTPAPQPEVTPTSVAPTTTPSQPAAPAATQATLPQTGNDDQPNAMAGLGLAGLGLLSALAWGRKKKRSTK